MACFIHAWEIKPHISEKYLPLFSLINNAYFVIFSTVWCRKQSRQKQPLQLISLLQSINISLIQYWHSFHKWQLKNTREKKKTKTLFVSYILTISRLQFHTHTPVTAQKGEHTIKIQMKQNTRINSSLVPTVFQIVAVTLVSPSQTKWHTFKYIFISTKFSGNYTGVSPGLPNISSKASKLYVNAHTKNRSTKHV